MWRGLPIIKTRRMMAACITFQKARRVGRLRSCKISFSRQIGIRAITAAMPEIVAHGRKPEVFACGFCHRADGTGGPENANLAGLPEAYIVQQMADFKSGARKSLTPERRPPALMTAVAKAATAAEVASAAAYFSRLKPRKLITVVETDVVPKTHVVGWVLSPVNDRDKEPIGHRIIETPKDVEQFESRDARSEFIAYVPVGSVAKGRGAGQDRREWENCSMRTLPRAGPEGARADTGHRRAFAELSGAAAL